MASTIGTAGGTVGTILTVPSPSAMDEVYAGTGSMTNVNMRLSFIDDYVASIDDRINPVSTPTPTPLLMVERPLVTHAFSDVAEEEWSSMVSYYDGSTLKRIRMLPDAGRTDTEEFTYDNGRLVHVSYKENGTLTGSDLASSAENFDFGQEGLIAWIKPDGTRMSSSDPDFAYWSNQLSLEGARFAGSATR
jgi:hypothetical protein